MKIRKDQIQKIKIAQKQLGLSDDLYRSLLSAWDVSSCKELAESQADEVLKQFKDMGWYPVKSARSKKYDYLLPRPGDYAMPAQLRKIEVIWRNVARNTSDKALSNFLLRQTGIKNITWLKKHHAESVLCALETMNQKEATS